MSVRRRRDIEYPPVHFESVVVNMRFYEFPRILKKSHRRLMERLIPRRRTIKPTAPQAAADMVNVNATRFSPLPKDRRWRRRRTVPLEVIVTTIVEIARDPDETDGAG